MAHRKTTPWSYRGAADAMMKLRIEIRATSYDIHSIRHTAASELGADGIDDDGIMSVTGHTTKSMVSHYAGQARQKKRAQDALKDRQ